MSDTLGDFNLLPVVMVDGQAPTARYFNAAFGQIETAFDLLSQVIGDFDGTGEGEDTYVPNLIRAFGNMGWINCRLPSNLKVPVGEGGGVGGDLPFIIEELDENFLGKKEAILTFLPAVSGANDPDITDVNMGTGVATGTPITQNLGVSDRFVLDGKRVLTSTAIPAGASLAYPVDTGSDLFRDSYGPENGCNVIPSMPQIYSNEASLCTITQPGGYQPNEYRIDFPTVTRIMNPQVPFSTEEGLDVETDTIQLDGNGPSPVRWSGTVPKYPIPAKIINLVSETLIPYNMVSLWFHNGFAPVRVRPTLSNDQFRWDQIPETLTSIKLTVPAGFTLPEEPGDEGANRYIVCFAGTSVADALVHERAHALRHSHDGNEGAPIEARDLTERFNPANWFHSTKAYHHFPQYFERGGFNDDTLNRSNAILGVLHLGPTSATESNTNTPSSIAADSWPLSFGHISLGPSLFANASDTVLESGTSGKLVLANTGLRVNEGNFFLGIEDGQEIGFDLDADAAPHPILDIRKYSGGADVGFATTQLGQLYVTGGQVVFDDRAEVDAPNFSYTPDGLEFLWTVLAEGVPTNTVLRVGRIETNSIIAINADDPIIQVIEAAAFSPFSLSGEFDFLEDGDLAFEGGTVDFDNFITGQIPDDNGLIFRGPFGSDPFAAGDRAAINFWQMEALPGDNTRVRVCTARVVMPGSLNRQRLVHAGQIPGMTLTGVQALMRTSGGFVGAPDFALFLKLYRVKTYNGNTWDLSGDSADIDVIYREQLTEIQVTGLPKTSGYFKADFDGDAVGDHLIDFNYDYYLFVGVTGGLQIDFYGCELTFETNLVA